MLKFNVKIFSFLFVVSMLSASFQGCNEAPQGEDGDHEEEMMEQEKVAEEADDEKLKGVHGLPSPIQIAATIKRSGINYDATVLNPTDNASNYSNNYKKSLNVGVYGADLGYAALYDQTQDAINYLNTVKSLADELGIIGAFERNTLDQVQENLGNQDKLLEIVTNAFFESDRYLQQHKRNKASALILAGGWVEGLYIACNMIKNQKDENIITRIGEQKITLGILMTLLGQFEDDAEVSSLTASLNDLKTVFDQVDITYEYNPGGNSETDAKDASTTILTKSIVTVTDDQLATITEKVGTIRATVIN